MVDDKPDEDKLLSPDIFRPKSLSCDHYYVDFYSGWGYVDKEMTKQVAWVFCKKCLNKRKLYIDMSEVYRDESDEA